MTHARLTLSRLSTPTVPAADAHPARAGDVTALFERLFADHRQPILNYLDRLLGDSALAEDLAQEAFTRAWCARAQLAQVDNHRAWLYRIATNAAHDHFRRARLIAWLPWLEREARLAEPGFEGQSLEAEHMRRALLKLAPEYRVPLVLYTCQDFSVAEIAQALGVSTDAVKQRLVRARQQLREAYQ
jgi:RNA polymerase sigma-70 factor (ECF subfamily)